MATTASTAVCSPQKLPICPKKVGSYARSWCNVLGRRAPVVRTPLLCRLQSSVVRTHQCRRAVLRFMPSLGRGFDPLSRTGITAL